MNRLLQRIRRILHDRRTRRILTRFVSVTAAIIVFVTTYALVLPAITMELQAQCGIEAHQHDDSCYSEKLVCGEAESPDHHHTDACYEKILTCEKEVHVHSAACYQTDPVEESAVAASTSSTFTASAASAMEMSSSADSAAGTAGTASPAVDNEDSTYDGLDYGFENVGDGMTETAAAAFTDTDNGAGYVPQLDPLDFNTVLNSHTGIYYHPVADGEVIEDSTLVPADGWIRIPNTSEQNTSEHENNVTLGRNDLLRVYLAYTIPAGSLNSSNPVVRYRLPGNIHLTDAQVRAINETVNGVAGQYLDMSTLEILDTEKYESCRGIEAVEGDRQPDESVEDYFRNRPELNGSEYISATVKVENVHDSDGDYEGQDLIFTFTPYSIEKNQHEYDSTGQPTRAGKEISGWLTLDFNLGQVDWNEATVDLLEREAEGRSEVDTELVERREQIADIVFVEEGLDQNDQKIDGISITLKLVEETVVEDQDVAVADKDDNISDQETTDNEQTSTDEAVSDGEAGEGIEESTESNTGAALEQSGQTNADAAEDRSITSAPVMPAMSFNDKITVSTGKPKDLGENDGGTVANAADTLPEKAEVIVRVEADEGTFPAGTTMILKAVDDLDAVAEAVTETVENTAAESSDENKNKDSSAEETEKENLDQSEKQKETENNETQDKSNLRTYGFQAVDITFVDAEGNEIEPAKPVRVALTSATVEQVKEEAKNSAVTDPVVVHVDDEGNAEQMELVAPEEIEPAQGKTEEEMLEETQSKSDGQNAAKDKGETSEKTEPAKSDEKTNSDESNTNATSEVTPGIESDSRGEDDYTNADTSDVSDTATTAATVSVEPTIDSAEPNTVDETQAGNDADDEGSEKDNAAGTASTVGFQADTFSVYAIVYTVDFHYDVDGQTYDFSIRGSDTICLRELLPILNVIKDDESTEFNEVQTFINDIEDVRFSDESLVKVVQITEDTTAGELREKIREDTGEEPEYSGELTEEVRAEMNAKELKAVDWALVSMKAFDSEEMLTVAMKSGEVFTIVVTDAQLSTELAGKTFLIKTNTNPPYAMTAPGFTYNYKGFLTAESNISDSDNHQLWSFEYDNSYGYGNTYRIKSVSENKYISFESSSNDQSIVFTESTSNAALFYIDKEDNLYRLSTYPFGHSLSYLNFSRYGNNYTLNTQAQVDNDQYNHEQWLVFEEKVNTNTFPVKLHFVKEDGTPITVKYVNGETVDGDNINVDYLVINNGMIDLSQFVAEGGYTLSTTHKSTTNAMISGRDHSIIGNQLKLLNNGTVQYQFFNTNSDKAGSGWFNAGYKPSNTNSGTGNTPDRIKDYYLVYSSPLYSAPGIDDQTVEPPNLAPVGKNKQKIDNGDGTYNLELSVSASSQSEQEHNKVNIILILDTSSSMERDKNDLNKGGSKVINGQTVYYDASTRRMTLTVNAINQFIDKLKPNNTQQNPDTVQMALVPFNAYAKEPIPLTNDLDSIKTAVGNQTTAQGTNWADALKKAASLTVDNDPTYVLFLTDGAPSQYWSSSEAPSGGLLFVDGGGCYLGAREEARALAATNRYFYGVFSFGTVRPEGDTSTTVYDSDNDYLGKLVDYAYNDEKAKDEYRFYAENGDKLAERLNQLLMIINKNFGHTNVDVKDGIALDTTTTALSNISGPLGTVTYSKTGGTTADYIVKVGSNGDATFEIGGSTYPGVIDTEYEYSKVSGSMGVTDITAQNATSTVYKCTVPSGEHAGTYVMPIAQLDIDETTKVGNLDWNLSPLGVLENGATYKISFVVWPDQEAYDYVADLNNGKEEWKTLMQTPVYGPDGSTVLYYRGGAPQYPNIVYYPDTNTYAALTNTYQEVTYYIADETIGGPGQGTTYAGQFKVYPDTPDPMPLTATGSRISKHWNVTRDPDILLRLLYKFDGDLPATDENGDPIPKPYTYTVIDEETNEEVEKTSPGFFIDFKVLQDTTDPTDPAATVYKTVRLGWDDNEGKYVWYIPDPEDETEDVSDYVKTKTYEVGEELVTLTYGTKWEQDFAIATGLMLTHDRVVARGLDPADYPHGTYRDKNGEEKTYYLLEDGHDYTLSEPALGYEYDFIAPTYHPMLVNGKMKSVLFTKSEDGKSISISEIEDMEVSKDGKSLLDIVNTLRGYIHLNKHVVDLDGTTPITDDDTKFEYYLELTNNSGDFTTVGSHIPWYGISGLFYHSIDEDEEYHYYQAEPVGTEERDGNIIGLLTLKDEDGIIHNATCDGPFNKDIPGPTEVTYYVTNEEGEEVPVIIDLYGNQMDYKAEDEITTTSVDDEGHEVVNHTGAYRKVSATLMITQEQQLNIANVPVNTRYTITEADQEGYQFVKVEANVPESSVTKNRTTISGTIIPDNETYVTYTNKIATGDLKLKKLVRVNEFDPQGDQVDSEDKTLADGTYTITVDGVEDTDTAGKSYEVKIHVDNSGDSTVYTLESFADNSNDSGDDNSGDEGDDGAGGNGNDNEGGEDDGNDESNPVSGELLDDGTVILKNLPLGEYIIKETQPDGNVVCIGVYCSDYSVSPNVNDRTVGVQIKGGEIGDKAKLVQFTNNYASSGDDIAHVSIRKTFIGLAPDKLPEDFKVNVTVNATIDGIPKTFHYTLRGSDIQPDGVVFNSAVVDGNVVWTWRIAIAGLKPDAVLNVEEQGYSRSGYDVIPAVNGHYGTEYNGIVSADTVVLSIRPEVISEQNINVFPVYDYGDSSKIFIARLPSNYKTALVISKKRLTLSEKAKIEYMLRRSMSKGGDWTWGGNDVLYYNFEEAGNNEIEIRGVPVTYSDQNGGEITFRGQYQWTHVGTALITYQPGRPADVNFVNSYTENEIPLDIIKTEKGSNPVKKLSGAAFTLKQIDGEATTISYLSGSSRTTPKTNAEGKTGFTGLTHGYYELTETTIPSGYVQTENPAIYFKIEDGVVVYLTKGDGPPLGWQEADNSETVTFEAAKEAIEDNTETETDETQTASNARFTITNEPGAELPSAGGPGTKLIHILGGILIGCSLLLLTGRKRIRT